MGNTIDDTASQLAVNCQSDPDPNIALTTYNEYNEYTQSPRTHLKVNHLVVPHHPKAGAKHQKHPRRRSTTDKPITMELKRTSSNGSVMSTKSDNVTTTSRRRKKRKYNRYDPVVVDQIVSLGYARKKEAIKASHLVLEYLFILSDIQLP